MRDIFLALPLSQSSLVLAVCCGLWTLMYIAVSIVSRKEENSELFVFWKHINLYAAIIWIVVLLYETLFCRTPSDICGVQPVPLSILRRVFAHELDPREKVLNIYAFVPLGILLTCGMPDRVKKRGLTAFACGFLLSFGAELNQYIWKLGLLEADDIITNTFGTAVGCILCLILERSILIFIKNKKKKQEN